MAFKPTIAQQNAINASAGTLVSAAAGSGKTAVLAERVVRLLSQENPISADRILVVTFMSEAAQEMRSRIEKRLNEECLAHPENKYLLAQKLKIRNAKISTIDSFCIELVREHFDALGIAPDFAVGDDIALSKIKDAALAEVLNREFEENDPLFIALLNALCSKFDEGDLKDAVTEIYNKTQNLPFPDEWLRNIIAKAKNDEFKSEILISALNRIEADFNKAIDYLKIANKAVESNITLAEKCCPVLLSDIGVFSDLIDSLHTLDWQFVFEKLNSVSFLRWPTIKNADSGIANAAKELRNKAKKIFESSKDLLYADKNKTLEDIEDSLSLTVKLLNIVLCFSEEFSKKCLQNNILTFSQAEHYALSLLCEYVDGKIILKNTAQDIINRFDEVLVDEFQDVNDMQDLLFRILSGDESRLFAVGDVKQSIYGFRGSNPANFLNKKQRYIPYEKAGENEFKKIILGNNFRSRKGICCYINYLFELLMNGEMSSIKYSRDEALVFSAKYPENFENNTEINFINITSKEKSVAQIEAEHIANFIKDYIKNHFVTDSASGELRKPKFSDFAIILRGVKSKGGIFANTLKERGIPVNFSANSALDSSEIKIMLSLLTVIANPTRDIELISVMMSPIFSFSANELAEIRAISKNTSMISAVTAAALASNKKCKDFLDSLNSYRAAAVTMSIGELLDYLYESTGFLNIVSALEFGNERKGNLIFLENLANDFEKENATKNIVSFVDFIRKISQNDSNACVSKFSEDAVKITTIHKSKGLQYPICILADLSKTFSGEDSRKNLITDLKNGVSFRFFNNLQNIKIESVYFKNLKRELIKQNYDEELRLFYVALTRAKEKLLIVCSGTKMQEKIDNCSIISSFCNDIFEYRKIAQNSSSYFDWILYSSVVHPNFNLTSANQRLILSNDSDIDFKYNEFKECDDSSELENNENEFCADFKMADVIRNNIEYVYPFEAIKSVASKSSVAEIAHKAEIRDFSFTAIPDFLSKFGMAPAKRGTATHRFMQFADFQNAAKSVKEELDRLYEWEFISENERDAVDISAVQKFFDNEIYARITKSRNMQREMRFLTEIPVFELDNTVPETIRNEKVIVQGSVDCVFIENDELVILDFKTDRIKTAEDLTAAYSEQLNIYAKACAKIFELPIKQLLIYSFALSKTIELPIK